MGHLVSPSTALAFLINVSENHKFTSSSDIQVKNLWMTTYIADKLDIIWQLEKGAQLLTYGIMLDSLTVAYKKWHDNTDRITESAKSGTKVFV